MGILYYLSYCIFVLLTVTIQVGFIQPLETITYGLNIVYMVMLFSLFYNRMYDFLIWTIFGGFLLDYFSAWPFGVMMVMIIIVVGIMFFISTLILTNRSLYALIVFCTIGIVVYNIVEYGSLYILHLLNFSQPIFSFFNIISITFEQIWRFSFVVFCIYYVSSFVVKILQKRLLR